MLWFPKEICFVRRDKINHMKQVSIFTSITKNEIQKLLVIVHAQALDFFIQPAFQHGSFVYRKLDTVLPRDV